MWCPVVMIMTVTIFVSSLVVQATPAAAAARALVFPVVVAVGQDTSQSIPSSIYVELLYEP